MALCSFSSRPALRSIVGGNTVRRPASPRAMERLRQNFNYAGIRVYLDLLMGSRNAALPHLTVPKLNAVNWKALKAAGIKGCVFDKDNTLTRPFEAELDIEAATSLIACKEAFGDAIVLFSNSAGLQQYDPQGQEAQHLEKMLGIPVLRHKEKKPSGSVQELEDFFGCSAASLAMVGDRLLTDVVFGNLNGMYTIYVEPMDQASEPIGVKLGRMAENQLWSDCRRNGLEPPKHAASEHPTSFVHQEK